MFYVQYLFFPYIVPLEDNVEKYCRGGQATDDNTALCALHVDT